MSARTPAAARTRRASARRTTAARRRRTAVRRRRLAIGVGLVLIAAAAATLLSPTGERAVRELALPLRHDDIIRQQADDKDLDPALIAAVIYAESHFRNGQTSSAGAIGLMQVTPATAQDIARRSGGTTFVTGDLHDPQVNISYGSYHLRYLSTTTAATRRSRSPPTTRARATSTAGSRRRASQGRELSPAAIPFPETRALRGEGPARARAVPRLLRRRAGSSTDGYLVGVPEFKLDPIFTPAADQPAAIDALARERSAAVTASRRCWARPAPARR